MTAFVVDVNVAKVANQESPQADIECVAACVAQLAAITSGGLIVLDDEMLILNEYRRNLRPAGQPGVGDAFMKWLWENQAVVIFLRRLIGLKKRHQLKI